MVDKHDDKSTIQEFKEVVNMTTKKLAAWLETAASKRVGYKEDEVDESVGHQSGRRIVEILKKRPDKYTAADIRHAQKVVGYVHRHLAQKPDGGETKTNWRYSLMNWGHDPESM